MPTSRPAHYDLHSRPDLVNSLADHLLQYPQDIVDTKRLIKYFQVSPEEFQQALLKTHQEEGGRWCRMISAVPGLCSSADPHPPAPLPFVVPPLGRGEHVFNPFGVG